MGVEIQVVYQGSLRCEATHGPSGNTAHTDAPVDNCGRGESFSPTDLTATALASCILTIIGILGERRELDLTGLRAKVVKEMHPEPPRRIGKLTVTVWMPAGIGPEDRQVLERSAHVCPVHQSLNPEIEIPIEFVYPD